MTARRRSARPCAAPGLRIPTLGLPGLPALALLVLAVLLAAGCGDLAELHHGAAPWEEHGGEAGAEPGGGHGVAAAADVPGAERWTADLDTVPVELAGHEGEFRVTARTGVLRHQPCAQCHADGAVRAGEGLPERAHWNVVSAHGDAGQLGCATCHAPDGTLRTLSGEPVGFDHSYKVCGTCHFEQVRDWAGGAHGKRLEAWAGERVVESCTACHDPHAPGFPVRTPATYNPHPEEPR